MGGGDRRRDDWGREAHYDRRHDYRDRSYGRDDRRQSYGRDDRHGYSRDSYGRDERRGYGRDSYDRRQSDSRDRYRSDREDRYRPRRDYDRPRRGGFRGRGRFDEGDRFEEEIDKEEEEYIRKRQEVLKARREKEEQYVAEEVDTEALAAMGLPTGFGAPQEREDLEEDFNERKREDRDGGKETVSEERPVVTEPVADTKEPEPKSESTVEVKEPNGDSETTVESQEPNGDSQPKDEPMALHEKLPGESTVEEQNEDNETNTDSKKDDASIVKEAAVNPITQSEDAEVPASLGEKISDVK